METNLRTDERFVEDKGWQMARDNYTRFLETNKDKKVLFLELGVGQNTPAIIKYPFMTMTSQFKNANYVCVNTLANVISDEIKIKSILIREDISAVISLLKKLK